MLTAMIDIVVIGIACAVFYLVGVRNRQAHKARMVWVCQGSGYQALELPYDRREMSVVILDPEPWRFGELEMPLDADFASEAIQGLTGHRIGLTMWRFEFESEFGLAETLKKMGMPGAFNKKASHFSGMDGNPCLATDDPCPFIGDVVSKTLVPVDEEYAEAVAAKAAVVTGPTSIPPKISVDRPFVFLMRDLETGALLFVGRVLDARG